MTIEHLFFKYIYDEKYLQGSVCCHFIIVVLNSCYKAENFDAKGGLRITFSYNVKNPANKDRIQIMLDELVKSLHEATGMKVYSFINQNGTFYIDIPGFSRKDSLKNQQILRSLRKTDTIGFWETYNMSELYRNLDLADHYLSHDPTILKMIDTNGVDLRQFSLNPLFSLMKPAVNNTGNGTEPERGPVIGYVAIRQQTNVINILNYASQKGLFPADFKVARSEKPFQFDSNMLLILALKDRSKQNIPAISANLIENSKVEKGESGDFIINLKFNKEGSHIFSELTRKNIGKSIAIALNHRVICYPTVQAEIKGGYASISGHFSREEAMSLAFILTLARYQNDFKFMNMQLKIK